MARLNLAMVPRRHAEVPRLVNEGDLDGFLFLVERENWWKFVRKNVAALKEREIYERTLLHVYTEAKWNNSTLDEKIIASLFKRADRERLRAAGDPVPDHAVVLYSGVAGDGPRRRERGFSWTDSLDVACVFAVYIRYLPDPAILKATVEPQEILAYSNQRNERDFIVRPRSFARVPIDQAEIKRRGDQYWKRKNAESPQELNSSPGE